MAHTARTPMRFGYGYYGTGRVDLKAAVKAAEQFGYDTFVMPDHLAEQLSPLPTLAVVAELSKTLRIAPWVLCNDFRLPQIVARELATIDALSEGRLDVGMGAGWAREEYERAGISFDSGGERLRRLQDSVAVVKAMLAGGPVSMKNDHLHVTEMVGFPSPIQTPHAPMMLGGGGRKMLEWAAKEADIVSIIPLAAPNGGLLASELTLGALQQKIGWVRDSAGAKFDDLVLNLALVNIVITADRRSVAGSVADSIRAGQSFFVADAPLSEDDLLNSPYFAFGTEREIAEHIEGVFEQTGVSYYCAFPHLSEPFGPILEHIHR